MYIPNCLYFCRMVHVDTRESNVETGEVSMCLLALEAWKRNNNNQSTSLMITSSHHSLSLSLFRRTLQTNYNSLELCVQTQFDYSHTYISSRSLSRIIFPLLCFFFLQDHRPLNRAVIGETLAQWCGQANNTHARARPGFMIILLFLLASE